MVEKPRKGAARISDIPADILTQLEAGTMESATLTEGLGINFSKLLAAVFPDLAALAKKQIDPKAGITKRMASASQLIIANMGPKAIKTLAAHPSDTVRGWATYAIASDTGSSLEKKLKQLQPLANDSHFGVREWAWLAIRPDIVAAPEEAITLLEPWVTNPSEFIRRFAVEAIRPRGVWSPHIAVLKQTPELALPILAPLKEDPSRYVQNSIANWLNDAYKSQPEWVVNLCEQWQTESLRKETAYIVKRALRSRKG